MIRLLVKIPREINLAFSGGVDSLACAHFLSRNHKVTLLHFNHGCEKSDSIEEQCRKLADSLGLKIIVGKIDCSQKPKKQSLEDFWRRKRYNFLRSFNQKFITCHHLDDALSNSIMSLVTSGQHKMIPIMDDLVIRPFLTTPKSEFISYAEKHNLKIVDDPYNYDQSRLRNYMDSVVVPDILKVRPGFYKVIKRMYEEKVKSETWKTE